MSDDLKALKEENEMLRNSVNILSEQRDQLQKEYKKAIREIYEKEEQIAQLKKSLEPKIDIIEFMFCSILFRHEHDDSYKITPMAIEHEKTLFKESLLWLKQFDKENIVLVPEDKIRQVDFS